MSVGLSNQRAANSEVAVNMQQRVWMTLLPSGTRDMITVLGQEQGLGLGWGVAGGWGAQ